MDGNKCHTREGATVAEALEQLHIPQGEHPILVVNGRHATRETVLKEGDTLDVYPLLAGG
jgi:sulfur carrier protein ThiS